MENGRIESIIEEGLIEADRIDTISNKINRQFDEIFDAIHEKDTHVLI